MAQSTSKSTTAKSTGKKAASKSGAGSKSTAASKKNNEAIFSTALSMDTSTRSDLIAMLQQHLADNHELYDQTKVAHWNVKGENFWQYHRLFDEIAEMIFPFNDEIAERITLLGGFAKGTSRQTAAATNVEEFPDGPQDGHTYLRELQTRFAEHASNSRKHAEASAEDDPTTEDLFIEVSRTVDKALYFIEAHLQQK